MVIKSFETKMKVLRIDDKYEIKFNNTIDTPAVMVGSNFSDLPFYGIVFLNVFYLPEKH